MRVRIQGRADAYFVLPFARRVKNEKLELRFRRLEKVRYISIYFGLAGEPFYESRSAVISTAVPGSRSASHSYHVRLPDGDYDRIRLSLKSRDEYGDAILESITVTPLELHDRARWVYAIALGSAFLLLLPGALLYVVLHGSRSYGTDFRVSLFAYSLLFYVVHYVLLIGALKVSSAHAHVVVVLGCVSAVAVLVTIVQRKSDWPRFAELVRDSWQELTAFVALLLMVSFALTYDANLPLENLFYTDISGPKTFGAFRAHDNVFQYLNGISIANDEPFEKYYGNHQLIYGVEDREILPGVVYAVFRALLSPLSPMLEKSYLVYTLLGIVMNLMIVFPAAAIARRYLGINNTLPFLLLFSVNAFVLGNYFITWFKLTAGALFLSGLFCMLEERSALRGWFKSGLFFGLAANMHAGSALGLPLFVLWGLMRRLRHAGRVSMRAVLAPVVFVIVFAVVIAPWAIVKRVYLNENHTLIKTHFLGGYSSPEGLGASARLFFDSVTLQEQASERLGRLKDAGRAVEIGELYRVYVEQGFKPFLHRWDQLEFTHIAILLYPMFLFVLFGWIYRKAWPVGAMGNGTVDNHTSRTMLTLSMLTMIILALAHYGRHAPDITYHQPMGVLALAYIVLIGFVWHANRFIRAVYFAYVAFTAYRLAAFL